jgi:transcriptional regulator with XRE-family HTH domain
MERDTVTSLDLGERLRAARVKRGLDVAKVAAHLGVEVREVDSWEAGWALPPMVALRELANVLGCSYDDLVA